MEENRVVTFASNIWNISYSTLLYSTLLYSNVCTVLCCTYCMYCTVLYCTVLYCTVLYCTVLYCTVLYCTVLCYFLKLNIAFVVLIIHNDNKQVVANSGAAKAGVRSGDIVTALDNNKVDTFNLFMSVSFKHRSTCIFFQDFFYFFVLFIYFIIFLFLQILGAIGRPVTLTFTRYNNTHSQQVSSTLSDKEKVRMNQI